MFEDILRAARKANGELADSVARSTIPERGSTSISWYKKDWFIWLLLIFFTPIGLIWMWLFAKYDNKAKCIFTVIFVAFLTIGHFYGSNDRIPSSKPATSSSYDVGYLRSGSSWVDGDGRTHYSSKKAEVEIWDRQVIMSNGERLTQIYFLSGEYTGEWGYVCSSSLSR